MRNRFFSRAFVTRTSILAKAFILATALPMAQFSEPALAQSRLKTAKKSVWSFFGEKPKNEAIALGTKLNWKPHQALAEGSPLLKYGSDYTHRAAQGEFPIFGSDIAMEVEVLLSQLMAVNKRNAAIIGPAGVGKTSAIQALAQNLVKGEVPERLKGKTIYFLDVNKIVAAERPAAALEEVLNLVAKHEEVIMFVDEVHKLAQANLMDLFKTHLLSRKTSTLFATTRDEFIRDIKDPAIRRRATEIAKEAPGVEKAIAQVATHLPRFTAEQGIIVPDSLLRFGTILAKDYITSIGLPDSAITLFDKAIAKVNTQVGRTSHRIMAMEEQLNTLQYELKASLREKGAYFKKVKVPELQEKIQKLQVDINAGKAIWSKHEKEYLALVSQARVEQQKLLKNTNDINVATLKGDTGAANALIAERTLLFESLGLIDSRIKALNEQLPSLFLTEKDLAEALKTFPEAMHLGVDEVILKTKTAPFMDRIFSALNKKLIGQRAALDALKDYLISATKLHNPNRGAKVILLVGPRDNGMTRVPEMLVKELNNGRADNLLTINSGAEYASQHQLIGAFDAPAGYVGHGEESKLLRFIREHVSSGWLFFRNIEAAHKDFWETIVRTMRSEPQYVTSAGTFHMNRITIFLSAYVDNLPDLSKVSDPLQRKRMLKQFLIESEKNGSRLANDRALLTPETLNMVDDVAIFGRVDTADVGRFVEVAFEEILVAELRQGDKGLSISPQAMATLKTLISESGGISSWEEVFEYYIRRPIGNLESLDRGSIVHIEVNPNNNGFSFRVEN